MPHSVRSCRHRCCNPGLMRSDADLVMLDMPPYSYLTVPCRSECSWKTRRAFSCLTTPESHPTSPRTTVPSYTPTNPTSAPSGTSLYHTHCILNTTRLFVYLFRAHLCACVCRLLGVLLCGVPGSAYTSLSAADSQIILDSLKTSCQSISPEVFHQLGQLLDHLSSMLSHSVVV